MRHVKKLFKDYMVLLAVKIDKTSKGKITAFHVTTLSLVGHVFVFAALLTSKPILAAILLGFFSALDALDGALARTQNKASLKGMYYDAVADRIKEIILYTGIAIFALNSSAQDLAWQVVILCGTSLLVSYTKAKGEMAISAKSSDAQKLNRAFGVGIASYEIRTVVLLISLLFNILVYTVPILIIATSATAITRALAVAKALNKIDRHVQN